MSVPLRTLGVATLGAAAILVAWFCLGDAAVDPRVALARPDVGATPARGTADETGALRTSPADEASAASHGAELTPGSHPLDTTPPAHATVLVVGMDGRPAPGATVWFQGELLPSEVRLSEQRADGVLRWLQANGAAVSADAAGRVVVPRTTNVVHVVAAKDGAVGMLELGIDEPTPVGGFRVVLAAAARLRIELVDAAGAAVPRAPLAYERRTTMPDAEPERRDLGVTDPTGVLEVVADDELLDAATRSAVVVAWPRTRLAASRSRTSTAVHPGSPPRRLVGGRWDGGHESLLGEDGRRRLPASRARAAGPRVPGRDRRSREGLRGAASAG